MIEQLDSRLRLHCGDCLDVLAELQPSSIDACVCDPPYGYRFMGKAWDHGVPGAPYWKAVLRTLKPGAHLVAFGGTRTYHRLACAIEDAGFEIRDQIQWLYGSGFPKSHDVSKGIDRANGVDKKTNGHGARVTLNAMGDGLKNRCPDCGKPFFSGNPCVCPKPEAVTDAARQWEGWGTALKPACEPIVLARKPLSESTVAGNVLRWGTGALNIDGCRVPMSEADAEVIAGMGGYGKETYDRQLGVSLNLSADKPMPCINAKPHELGRWPANVILDGSEEVQSAFPEVHSAGSARPDFGGGSYGGSDVAFGDFGVGCLGYRYGDPSGTAARFFYSAKAGDNDRLGSKHPTVKPVDLMQYLVRLVTPPKGIILDPFAGTGTTGEAALREGMAAVLIEREEKYQADIRRRIKLWLAGPDERHGATMKEKLKDKPVDMGPLFGGAT